MNNPEERYARAVAREQRVRKDEERRWAREKVVAVVGGVLALGYIVAQFATHPEWAVYVIAGGLIGALVAYVLRSRG